MTLRMVARLWPKWQLAESVEGPLQLCIHDFLVHNTENASFLVLSNVFCLFCCACLKQSVNALAAVLVYFNEGSDLKPTSFILK